MNTYDLSHVPDSVLLRDLAALVDRDRAAAAVVLAHLAEVEARRLDLPDDLAAATPTIKAELEEFLAEPVARSEEPTPVQPIAPSASRPMGETGPGTS